MKFISQTIPQLIAATMFAAVATAAHAVDGTPPATGPTSKLYLDSYSDKTMYILQGTQVLASAPTYCNHCEAAIAVNGDIRSMGLQYGIGGLYRLDLSQTGTIYTNETTYSFGDGATDGIHNFAASDKVYSFDRDWTHQNALFTLQSDVEASGITYDPVRHSLWIGVDIVDTDFSEIRQYSMTGSLLSSFSTQGGRGLAMDYADGTLWTIRGPARYFDQYSVTGSLLQTAMYTPVLGFQGGFVGAEFDLAVAGVPEPSSVMLWALGVFGLVAARARADRTAPAA